MDGVTQESLHDFLIARLPEFWQRLQEHILLTSFSTLLAIAISVPLALAIFRYPRLRTPAMAAISMLQTIPSMALLVVLLALFQKIGALPAITALTLYALLPITRNMLVGIETIDPNVMEAARGIGMTNRQQLLQVRIPIAMPVILSGIRTATNIGVGIATIAAFIGAGGLGQFINRGLFLSDERLILMGAIPAALLALTIDLLIGALGWSIRYGATSRRHRHWRRPIRFGTIALLTAILSWGMGGSMLRMWAEHQQRVITIASKPFTEQYILGELMAQMIEGHTDLKVKRKFGLGGSIVLHGALLHDEIDLYPEYSGTALATILNVRNIPRAEAWNRLKHIYHAQFGMRWMPPFGFSNTYAIAVRSEDAQHHNWHRISDLVPDAPELRAGFDFEFAERPDGYLGLADAYDLRFADIRDLDPNLMYEAIYKGEVDVISGYSTEGRLKKFGLVLLKDDRQFFPDYIAAPVLREKLLERHPQIAPILSRLGGTLTNATMRRLNYEADFNRRPPAEVARAFLLQKGLLPPEPQ